MVNEIALEALMHPFVIGPMCPTGPINSVMQYTFVEGVGCSITRRTGLSHREGFPERTDFSTVTMALDV